MGFVSIINLRESTEAGAEVEKEEVVARTAGLRYFHVPFNGTSPDPKAADNSSSHRPRATAFIHAAAASARRRCG
jgi:protein tyrosine phosphatase (PTP) superfamily phosphohydrolase (DUF442 family)